MTDKAQGISKITVKGFKSLYDETSIDIRPLTILAGANSSGKSSIMQPLLLMKQTLESEYKPNIFLLNGPNVRFTDARQFFHVDNPDAELSISIDVDNIGKLSTSYSYNYKELKVLSTNFTSDKANGVKNRNGKLFQDVNIYSNSNYEDFEAQISDEFFNLRDAIQNITTGGKIAFTTEVYRCFLNIGMSFPDGTPAIISESLPFSLFPLHFFSSHIQDIIHVSGLRDNPQRNYPVASIDGNFKGKFDDYFASIIAQYEFDEDLQRKDFIGDLLSGLMHLELGSGISTSQRANEISISISNSISKDAVNIADVGLGVSQILPILVALLVAKEGQLVYLEQPELHLHPRAQVALAQILADAANRGVRVVVETHSSLLLIGIQTLIAEGKLKPEDTILHWFMRDAEGKTTVDSQTPDENGAYGDWQEDFADVELYAQSRYMEAVEKNLVRQAE